MNDDRRILQFKSPPHACRRASWRSGALMISVALVCVADSSPAKPKGESGARQATVIEVTGKKHAGALKALDSESITIQHGGAQTRLSIKSVLRVDFPLPRPGRHSAGDFVILANGDRLLFKTTGLDGDNLIGLRGTETIRIPMATVRGIMFRVPEAEKEYDAIARLLNTHDEKGDLLILRNGDRLSGRIKSLSPTSVAMNNAETKSPLAGIRALAFDPRYIAFPKSKEPTIVVGLADGSRVTARTLATRADDRLRIEAAYGGVLDVAMSSIVSLRILGGNGVALSDLQPTSDKHTSFLGSVWKAQPDRNVKQGRLMLRGREYTKGIGMHSESRLTYDLAGQYQTFHATVGIDDIAEGRGSVRVAVEVDGKRVFHSPEITGKSDPLTLAPIDISGKKRLTLVVEFGEFADLLDIVDWCDAVVVKSAK